MHVCTVCQRPIRVGEACVLREPVAITGPAGTAHTAPILEHLRCSLTRGDDRIAEQAMRRPCEIIHDQENRRFPWSIRVVLEDAVFPGYVVDEFYSLSGATGFAYQNGICVVRIRTRERICSEPGCTSNVHARKLCAYHYKVWYRNRKERTA